MAPSYRGGGVIGHLQCEFSDSDTIPVAGNSDAEEDDLLKKIHEDTLEGVDLSSLVAAFIDKSRYFFFSVCPRRGMATMYWENRDAGTSAIAFIRAQNNLRTIRGA